MKNVSRGIYRNAYSRFKRRGRGSVRIGNTTENRENPIGTALKFILILSKYHVAAGYSHVYNENRAKAHCTDRTLTTK